MAEKRMFAKSIVMSDKFLEMPVSARCLYFTLGIVADDRGFVGNPKSVIKLTGTTEDDLKVLVAKRYVLAFESGVIVIKHWDINNYIRSDRLKETTYVEEFNTLTKDDKNAYTELDRQLTGNCPHRLDKNNKNNKDKCSIAPQNDSKVYWNEETQQWDLKEENV